MIRDRDALYGRRFSRLCGRGSLRLLALCKQRQHQNRCKQDFHNLIRISYTVATLPGIEKFFMRSHLAPRPSRPTCAINKVIMADKSIQRTGPFSGPWAFPWTGAFPLDGYRRALRFIVPYWPRLVFVLLAGIAATGFGLLQPYISKLLIDDALLKHNLRMLLMVSGLMFGVTVLGFVLNIFSSYQYVRVSASVLFDMRLALYQHLQTLSPRFWASRKLGDVVSRINNDIAEVQRVSADSLLSVLSNVVFLIGSAAIMIALSPRLFLVSVAAVPASVWALQHYQHRLASRVRAVRERSSDIGSFLLETLLGIRLVVSARAESREVERFRARNQSFLDALMRMQLTAFLSGAVPGTILTLSTAAIFLYGGKLVIDGALTTGSLVAIDGLPSPPAIARAEPDEPVQQSGFRRRLSFASLGAVRHARRDCRTGLARSRSVNVRGEIEFDRVSFGYGGDAVLENLSFRVAPGTICAILGPSGAGKSTLADLLVRFYDPDAGAIRIDGRDLRDLPLADLRHAGHAGGSSALSVSCQRAREHRLRPAGGERRRDRERCPGRVHPRTDPGFARWLRHDHRRTRPDAFGGRAPTHRAGPGFAGRSESLNPRRTDLGAG